MYKYIIDTPFYVLIINEFSDGYETSAGFFRFEELSEEGYSLDNIQDNYLLYNSKYSLHMPVDFYKKDCFCFNTNPIDNYKIYNRLEYCARLQDIDLPEAELQNDGAFIGEDDIAYDWCIIIGE